MTAQPIPIRNLYFLLLYAWDYLEAADEADVGAFASDQPVDLLAFVLAKGVERILKHGIDRDYVAREERTSRPRGRIDFRETVRRASLGRRQLYCSFDELSHDVVHNRILKATLRQLGEHREVARELRHELLRLYARFIDVPEVAPTSAAFRQVRLHRSNRVYGRVMSVCRLIHDGLVVEQAGGGRRFLHFVRDERRMRALFQAFVTNLLRRKAPVNTSVSGRRLHWQDVSGPERARALLPTLNLDVVVDGPTRSVIIDTKYTPNSLSIRFARERVREEHLYQLFAYLRNYQAMRPSRPIDGLLLYPAVSGHLDESLTLAGHRVTWATVDLSADWKEIEARIVGLGLRVTDPS